MKLKIIVIPTIDELNERDSTLINEAQHDLLNLREEAIWIVERSGGQDNLKRGEG